MIGRDPYPVSELVGFGSEWGERTFDIRVRNVPQIVSQAAEVPSFAAGFHFVPHHLAHATCAFHASGLQSAALLVVDGIGESATTWLGRGSRAGIEMIEEIPYPHSIGMLWERMAAYLGFGEYDAAKVMGTCGVRGPATVRCGHGSRVSRLRRWRIGLGSRRASVCSGSRTGPFPRGDVEGLESLFGRRRQAGESPTDARFADVAAALQMRTEDALLALARRLKRASGESNLAYSGGVALNCVANSRLERDGPFQAIHVYAAPHDAGTAIVAALILRIASPGLTARPWAWPAPR